MACGPGSDGCSSSKVTVGSNGRGAAAAAGSAAVVGNATAATPAAQAAAKAKESMWGATKV